ncbi:MAG: hypothetical protein HJJLKODD_00682 [Phycisphaerae bacterium]|nr:hypothetical protein [Phycisphaerae bacterium]
MIRRALARAEITSPSTLDIMFEPVLPISQCPPGTIQRAELHQRPLAVYHLLKPDCFMVSDAPCPHAGAHLADGQLIGANVICPVHHWKMDLATGHCLGVDRVYLRRYACIVEQGLLKVDLDQPLPVPPPAKYHF